MTEAEWTEKANEIELSQREANVRLTNAQADVRNGFAKILHSIGDITVQLPAMATQIFANSLDRLLKEVNNGR